MRTKNILIITLLFIVIALSARIAWLELASWDTSTVAPLASPDGTLYLLETKGNSGLFISYCVTREHDTWNNIIYTTSSWFSGRFRVQATWANDNNDFFVISSDCGVLCYRYENTAWVEYFFDRPRDASGNRIPQKYVITRGDWAPVTFSYEVDNIPPKVLAYVDERS